jgi:hypothetical protein
MWIKLDQALIRAPGEEKLRYEGPIKVNRQCCFKLSLRNYSFIQGQYTEFI